MKLWSSVTILLLLSLHSVVSVSESAEGDDDQERVVERVAEQGNRIGPDHVAQQVPQGSQSAKDGSGRVDNPQEGDGGLLERQEEGSKLEAHQTPEQGVVDVASSSPELLPDDVPLQQKKETIAQEESSSQAQQINVAHQTEESKSMESGGVVLETKMDSAAMQQDQGGLSAAVPQEASTVGKQPGDEGSNMEAEAESESTASKGESNDVTTNPTETGSEAIVNVSEGGTPENISSDADAVRSEEGEREQADDLSQASEVDVDSADVTLGSGSEMESEEGVQSTSDPISNTAVDQTDQNEPHPQDANDTTVAAASAPEVVEGETSTGSKGESLPPVTADPAPSEVSYTLPVCGVWGRWQTQPRADLRLLYLLFEDVTLGESPRKEIPNPKEWASRITEDAIKQSKRSRRATSDTTSSSTSSTDQDTPVPNGTGATKSANSEFVDGLDDIDKFFEEIDPPDELDVGAVGTSLQEVLMGQGTRIVLKRLQMGLNFARKTFLTVKDKLAERFIDEDGNVSIFDQEKIEAASAWVWKSSKRLYHEARVLLDNIIERGIAGGLSREYEEDEVSSQTPPGSNEDVRELLRQYSRVGGGATARKYA